jgi:RNA polymerase sigma factor (sigma-70 family)
MGSFFLHAQPNPAFQVPPPKFANFLSAHPRAATVLSEMPATDRQLLHQYLQGNHAPFEDLVRRHIDVIYAAARRQIGPIHADDITQSVFIMLAQKARTLQHRESLIGWLYRAAMFCCFNLRRAEALRRQHERQAAMAAPAPTREPTDLAELLDAALAKLGDRDREVLLLHHLQQKSHGETAAALGISEEAARKRAARALEKLRVLFLREGTSAPLISITTLFAAQAATKSPPALLASTLTITAHTALAGSSSLGGWLLVSTVKTKFAIIAASLLLIATAIAAVELRPARPPTAPIATPRPDPSFIPPFNPPETPEPSQPGFTPVTEFSLPQDGSRQVTFLDLDHGRAFRPPFPLPTPAHPTLGMIDFTPDLLDWMKARSITAIVVSGKSFFTIVHLQVRCDSPADPHSFVNAKPADVIASMSALPAPPTTPQPWQLVQYLPLPVTDFFRTADGAFGMLQITGPHRDSSYYLQPELLHPFGGIPASIRIRYKRVLPK